MWEFSRSEFYGTVLWAFDDNWLIWNHWEMCGNTRLNTHKIIIISMWDKDTGVIRQHCHLSKSINLQEKIINVYAQRKRTQDWALRNPTFNNVPAMGKKNCFWLLKFNLLFPIHKYDLNHSENFILYTIIVACPSGCTV